MRFELTLRDEAMTERAAPLLREYGINKINVTDVSRDIDQVGMAARISRAVPGLDLMPHVAAKHHDAATFGGVLGRIEDAGMGKALVVSGFPLGPFDSLAALGAWGSSPIAAHCVYDPYFAGRHLSKENARLEAKLTHASVRGVILQIGMDRQAFSDGVRLVRRLRPDAELSASLPIPSAALLRRLQVKMLHGVFLDPAYYFSLDTAWKITRDMAAMYREEGVEPLCFSDSFDKSSIEQAMALE